MTAKQTEKKKNTPKSLTKQSDKKTAIDVETVDINENKLMENPLLQSQIMTIDSELDTKVAMIHEIESIAELNKQQLMVKRQRVELEVDNKKLDVAKKTISNIEKIMNAVSTEEVLKRVAENINTPQDMKYMAEAAEKFANTLKNLMNPNVQDEFGTKKRHKINFMFKGEGTAAVQIETSND